MLAVSFVGAVYAGDQTTITTAANLTEAQKAELAATAAKMASDNAAEPKGVPTPAKVEVVKQWVDIGTAIGSGLAASAKELGIAANEFAQTPVGRFTVFLIAWHFIGSTLLHVAFSLMWFITLTTILIWLYRRNGISKTVTYYDKGAGPNGARKVVKTEPRSISEGVGTVLVLGSAVTIIVFIVMLCNL